MAQHNCANCKIRTKYDNNPKSFVGKIWRWHIGFCPGWKSYFNSLSEAEQERLRVKYNIKVGSIN